MGKKLVLAAIGLWSSLGMAAGFEGRTEFSAVGISGQLHLICREGSETESKFVWCEDLILEPFEFGFFTAEANTGADEVSLSCRRADGKLVEKSLNYDSAAGRSKSRVNLWIETLLQTALLDVGDNPVSYRLLRQGAAVQDGQFTVVVDRGPERQCPRGIEQSASINDCRFPNQACDRYFRYFDYCR